jgi:hypothetical protein
MNSEIIKSEMMLLIGREKTDMIDTDVVMAWML